MKNIFKIHYSKLDSKEEPIETCACCGMPETMTSNGDVRYCTDCYSVEQGTILAYLGLDGKEYLEHEIDWESEILVGI